LEEKILISNDSEEKKRNLSAFTYIVIVENELILWNRQKERKQPNTFAILLLNNH
jgi:hypothetical protein